MNNQVQKLDGEKVTEGKAISKFDAFKTSLAEKKEAIQKVLPSHIKYEKFQSVVLTACMANPELIQADRASMMLSCVKVATDGLLPDNRDAALVIFNAKSGNNWIKKVQYMPMYAGILKKVRQSGELASINTQVVYSKDFFEHKLGDEDSIVHSVVDGDDRGEFKAVYCIARLKDGTTMREVMYRSEIEKVRKTSKSGNDNDGKPKGIWKDWYEEMAKKTVFRRLSKWLPQSIDKEGNETHIFENDESMDIIGDYEELQGEDKGEIEGQPDLKKIVEEKKVASNEGENKESEAVEEKKPAAKKVGQKKAKPAEAKEEKVEEETPHDEETGEIAPIDALKDDIEKATEHADFYDLITVDYAEFLAALKAKDPQSFNKIDITIQAKMKALEAKLKS